MIMFRVPTLPVAEPRKRVTTMGGKTRTYTPTSAPVNTFKAAVQMAFRSAYQGTPISGPLAVKVVFLFPRTTKHKANGPREWRPKKPDIDNLQKSLFDALNQLAWQDDNQICSVIAEKQTANGEESPCVLVAIRRL